MNFSPTHFKKELTKLLPIIDSNPTVPITGCFKFESQGDGTVTVTATNLRQTIRTQIACECTEPFAACIDAKPLCNLIASLPEQPVSLTLKDNHAIIKAHTGTYKLPLEKPADFPGHAYVRTEKGFNLSGIALKKAIQNTSFAASTDELRPNLTGIMIEFSHGEMTAVATNGHMLMKVVQGVVDVPDFNCIIPRKSADILTKLLPDEPVWVQLHERRISFESGSMAVEINLIDERYVEWRNVIGKNELHMRINRYEFISAISRCMIALANSELKIVQLTILPEQINIYATDKKYGQEATEVLNLAQTSDMQKFIIGITAPYMLQILTHLEGEEVELTFTRPERAIHVTGEESETFALVMPTLVK